jgi:hypothetical protein
MPILLPTQESMETPLYPGLSNNLCLAQTVDSNSLAGWSCFRHMFLLCRPGCHTSRVGNQDCFHLVAFVICN